MLWCEGQEQGASEGKILGGTQSCLWRLRNWNTILEQWGTTGGFSVEECFREGFLAVCGVWTEGCSMGLTWRLEDSEEDVVIQERGGAVFREEVVGTAERQF